MKLLKRLNTTTVILLGALLWTLPLQAERRVEEILQKLQIDSEEFTPREIATLRYGVKRYFDSGHALELPPSVQKESPVKSFFQKAEKTTGSIKLSNDQPVIKHLRGNQGVAFPSEEQAQQSWLPISQEKMAEKIREVAKNTMRKGYELGAKPRILPLCQESRTQRTYTRYSGEDRKELLTDILYLPEGFNIEQPGEAFGKQTTVIVYDNRPRAAVLSSLSLGITCLPSRIRISKHASFRQTGLDALKKYGAGNPDRGQVLERVQARWEEFVR